LFIPLPIYWSLLAQQDSSWTFQATRLDTRIFGVFIEPEQIKALGPILLLILIPLCQKVMLPFLKGHNLHISPLQSCSFGGLCAALSFVCAGLLQLRIESSSNNQQLAPSLVFQIPQFFLLMLGEVFLAIPGLQFSFTQVSLIYFMVPI
jgi:dipeptide/tripeptide permease